VLSKLFEKISYSHFVFNANDGEEGMQQTKKLKRLIVKWRWLSIQIDMMAVK
jgi:hypothetical protein